jgi:hypothetical protein
LIVFVCGSNKICYPVLVVERFCALASFAAHAPPTQHQNQTNKSTTKILNK